MTSTTGTNRSDPPVDSDVYRGANTMVQGNPIDNDVHSGFIPSPLRRDDAYALARATDTDLIDQRALGQRLPPVHYQSSPITINGHAKSHSHEETASCFRSAADLPDQYPEHHCITLDQLARIGGEWRGQDLQGVISGTR